MNANVDLCRQVLGVVDILKSASGVEEIAKIAAECGDKRADIIDYFATGDGIAQINSLVDKVTGLGVSGVPFFIFQRRLAVSGAQSSTALAAAIMQAMELPGPE